MTDFENWSLAILLNTTAIAAGAAEAEYASSALFDYPIFQP